MPPVENAIIYGVQVVVQEGLSEDIFYLVNRPRLRVIQPSALAEHDDGKGYLIITATAVIKTERDTHGH